VSATATFNRAAGLAGAGDLDAAGRTFLHAAAQEPTLYEAYLRALRCALSLVRQQKTPAVEPVPAIADSLVSVICCSVTPAKLATLTASLDAALSHWELVHIGDAQSLAEGYTRGMQRAKGDLLVFCHDDIRILAPDFSQRLRHYLARYDVIGVAGATRFAGPAALWGGPPHSHGWLVYNDGARQSIAVSSTRGPVVENAAILDGVFIAARREVAQSVGWDASTFDGFHLYDADFTVRAARAGARMAICQDLMIEHASRGGFDAAWSRYAERFARKFPALKIEPHHDGPNAVELSVQTDAEAVGVFSWLREWTKS
jgi:hypothetical protein